MKAILAKMFIVAAIVCLSSCRIGVAAFKGGDVISASGSRDCLEGRTCELQVNDTNFTEVFTAQPKAGYEFVKWRAGEGYLCANSTSPVCTVSNVGGEGNAAIEAVVASEEMFYIVPEFECVLSECPDILLDSVLLELEDQSQLVEAYVAQVGDYPPTASSFGLSTYYRPSPSLIAWIDIRPSALSPGYSVYLFAAVYTSLWDGGTPNTSNLAYFSLSGSTNADNTMSWDCIPGNGAAVPAVPYSFLPIQCRG